MGDDTSLEAELLPMDEYVIGELVVYLTVLSNCCQDVHRVSHRDICMVSPTVRLLVLGLTN